MADDNVDDKGLIYPEDIDYVLSSHNKKQLVIGGKEIFAKHSVGSKKNAEGLFTVNWRCTDRNNCCATVSTEREHEDYKPDLNARRKGTLVD